MSDPLPTESQREAICEMIATAFIEIRLLGWDGNAAQAADLADAFHNVPREIYGWGSWSWSIFRRMLESYQKKYAGAERTFDFLARLNEIERTA